MIVSCISKEDIEKAVRYVSSDCKKAPHLFINLVRYGVDHPDIHIWVDKEIDIQGVYVQYYDCLHFMTKELQYPCQTALELIEHIHPKVIMAPSDQGERIQEHLKKTFQVEKSYVFSLDRLSDDQRTSEVKLASFEELEEIVELMLLDPEYAAVYEKESLLFQFKSRLEDRFSRFFFIRRENKIVAAYCTYGEIDGLALLGGLMVHPQYRRQGLAQTMMREARRILQGEDLEGVSCVNFHNIASYELHQKLGATTEGIIYKFIRI